MTKVLLLSPNIEVLPDPVFPLGLAYIAASLKKAGIPHRVLDLCFATDFKSAIADEIEGFSPDIIGISLRNIDNVSFPEYTSYLSFYRDVVRTVRKKSPAVIVLGGSGFTLMPEALVDFLDADFGIAGEGETVLIRFIDDFNNSRLDQSTRVIHPGPETIRDVDKLAAPDRSLFDNEAYLKWGGMGNIQTKRGCPFQCIYCTYPLIEGPAVRGRNPASVCDEMERLAEDGIDTLFIVDNEFNYPEEHAQSICREIIERRIALKWGCYANPGFLSSELVDLMRDAGCTGLEFGTDAADPDMLVRLGKNFTPADIQRASDICRKAGMPFCHSLLLGGPGETMESVNRTLDGIKAMSPTAVICMIGLRIFPRTRLSRIAIEEGVIDANPNYLDPLFYVSPAIVDRILPFIETFSKENPTWIFPGFNINMKTKLQRKMRGFGFKGPLWEYMKMGKLFNQK